MCACVRERGKGERLEGGVRGDAEEMELGIECATVGLSISLSLCVRWPVYCQRRHYVAWRGGMRRVVCGERDHHLTGVCVCQVCV